MRPHGVLGSWGEGPFIFRGLGNTGNCIKGAGQQAHTFEDLGSTAKKLRKTVQGIGVIRALFLVIK